MNILHIAPITMNKSNGVSVVVPQIVSNQNKINGINSSLLNTRAEVDFDSKNIGYKYMELNYSESFSNGNLNLLFSETDIAVLHTFYEPIYLKISKELKSRKIPYVIFPHGSLTKEAQNRKKIKKILGNLLYFNKIINSASSIQYLSQSEAENSRKWKNNFFVLGNGIDLPTKLNTKNNIENDESNININFIGRLDIQHKGLDYLLEVAKMGKVFLEKNNAVINIYGPDQNGSTKIIENYINENKLTSVVKIKGAVYGKEKEKIYLETDIFILTSRHEGLPTGVLEALSYGIPCLLTPGTNLANEVEKYRCGWQSDSKPENILEKLKFIIEEFEDMEEYSKNAVSFVKETYSWEIISEKAIKKYKQKI